MFFDRMDYGKKRMLRGSIFTSASSFLFLRETIRKIRKITASKNLSSDEGKERERKSPKKIGMNRLLPGERRREREGCSSTCGQRATTTR